MSAKFTPSETVDFVIVGAGAAGGVMAKELSTAGFRVVVLEQGPYLREKDFGHDEIRYQYMEGLTNDIRTQPLTFRASESQPARRWKAIVYGRQVGGGSVHFAANYWRFHESDFHEHSLFGGVSGAGLADWPISYADLAPYYDKAEREIGISGLAGANTFEAPRSGPYPLPPMPIKSSGAIFEKAARELGLHPFPAPVAIISQPYQGRAACTHCGFCSWFGCEMRAKSSTLVSVIPVAERTGRCEIRAQSYARRIATNSHGRCTGVVYFDARKREVFQRAKAVVVCANGVETPRLLLMSKSATFPNGLANSSGLIGKYLMWDNYTQVYGLFEHPLNEFKSIRATRVLHDYYRSDPKRGFYGGAGLDARFGFYPASFAIEGLPPDAPRWGSEYKSMIGEYFNRTMTIAGHVTSLPQIGNSVSLDPEVRDAWGLPAARITFSLHEDDLKTMRWVIPKQVEILETAGAQKIWSTPAGTLDVSAHLMGTCRMGADPRYSVVTPTSRAHDVPNLFIVDGSNFVTSARQQPTATIQAIAYHAADHIIRAARSGELATP